MDSHIEDHDHLAALVQVSAFRSPANSQGMALALLLLLLLVKRAALILSLYTLSNLSTEQHFSCDGVEFPQHEKLW